MAVHLSRRRASRASISSTIPVGTPVSFELTSSGVMNSFFVPQLGGQIYTMAGMMTQLNLQADDPGNVSRHVGRIQRRRFFRDAFQRRWRFRRRLCALGGTQRRGAVRRSMHEHTPIWSSRARRSRHSPIGRSPGLFEPLSAQDRTAWEACVGGPQSTRVEQ